MTRGHNWLAVVLNCGRRISLLMQNLFECQSFISVDQVGEGFPEDITYEEEDSVLRKTSAKTLQ